MLTNLALQLNIVSQKKNTCASQKSQWWWRTIVFTTRAVNSVQLWPELVTCFSRPSCSSQDDSFQMKLAFSRRTAANIMTLSLQLWPLTSRLAAPAHGTANQQLCVCRRMCSWGKPGGPPLVLSVFGGGVGVGDERCSNKVFIGLSVYKRKAARAAWPQGRKSFLNI